MDSDSIRRPPKPAPQFPTALFMSPQLDLTPEKKTNKPKQNCQKNISEAPTEKTEESKEIYAWYVYCDVYCHEILNFEREQSEQAKRFCCFCSFNTFHMVGRFQSQAQNISLYSAYKCTYIFFSCLRELSGTSNNMT